MNEHFQLQEKRNLLLPSRPVFSSSLLQDADEGIYLRVLSLLAFQMLCSSYKDIVRQPITMLILQPEKPSRRHHQLMLYVYYITQELSAINKEKKTN